MVSLWAAAVLDLAAGDPYWFPHPVRFIGSYISWFERQVRKLFSSPLWLKAGGVCLVVTTVLLSFVIPYFLLKVAAGVHFWLYHLLNVVFIWTCLAARCLQNEGMKVYQALASGDLGQARTYLSYIVGRDTTRLDEGEITRATVETLVENTSDGIIAPLFYIAIGGAPLGFAYKAVNTMDSMVGYKNERFLHFGWAAAKVDDMVNYIPARLTGLFLVAASFFLGLDYRSAWRILNRDRKNHSSPNCGYPEAATAGALGIRLGGTNCYFDRQVFKPTMGDPKRPINKEDIKGSVRLMYVSSLLMLVVVTVIWILLRSN